MNINDIVTIISTVGFPIVCCIVMFKIYREDLKKMQESINNNTLVIQKLIDKLNEVSKND